MHLNSKHQIRSFQQRLDSIGGQYSPQEPACYKSINIKSRQPCKSMSHSECTINTVPILHQHGNAMQDENQNRIEDVSIEVSLPRHQPEPMDIEHPSSEIQQKEDSEYLCKQQPKRKAKKGKRMKSGNSNDPSPKTPKTPKTTTRRAKKLNEAAKLHCKKTGGVGFVIQDEYLITSVNFSDGSLNCSSQLPLSIQEDLISNQKNIQLNMTSCKDSQSLNSQRQVLIRYQTLAFKDMNFKVYCWSFAASQNQEMVSNRLRSRNQQKMDPSELMMYEQINMSRDEITIYFNNAKYRFSFSNINKAIEELTKEELLNKRDNQGQLVYYNDKKVKVLPRLLEIASLEYVNLVQMKRMMIRRRLYSPVRP